MWHVPFSRTWHLSTYQPEALDAKLVQRRYVHHLTTRQDSQALTVLKSQPTSCWLFNRVRAWETCRLWTLRHSRSCKTSLTFSNFLSHIRLMIRMKSARGLCSWCCSWPSTALIHNFVDRAQYIMDRDLYTPCARVQFCTIYVSNILGVHLLLALLSTLYGNICHKRRPSLLDVTRFASRGVGKFFFQGLSAF